MLLNRHNKPIREVNRDGTKKHVPLAKVREVLEPTDTAAGTMFNMEHRASIIDKRKHAEAL